MAEDDQSKQFNFEARKQRGESSQASLFPGQLVRSIAGRDKGQMYLVLKQDGTCLWVVDGAKRGIANPKKKNRRHVQHCNKIAADFVAGLSGQNVLTIKDEDIRGYLNKALTNSRVFDKEGEA